MRFFILPIFDGVIMDGHPIFEWWMQAYPVSTMIKILDTHPLRHFEDGQNKKSHLLFSFLVRIVLFLHLIGGIYLSKILLHHFIGFI